MAGLLGRRGEIMAAVQVAMIAGLPYSALRDAVLTHPTLVEGLIPLFSSPAVSAQRNRGGSNNGCVTLALQHQRVGPQRDGH